jgi:hypothetical protein
MPKERCRPTATVAGPSRVSGGCRGDHPHDACALGSQESLSSDREGAAGSGRLMHMQGVSGRRLNGRCRRPHALLCDRRPRRICEREAGPDGTRTTYGAIAGRRFVPKCSGTGMAVSSPRGIRPLGIPAESPQPRTAISVIPTTRSAKGHRRGGLRREDPRTGVEPG